MKRTWCPRCKKRQETERQHGDVVRCQGCGAILTIFPLLLSGVGLCLVSVSAWFGLGQMFIDVCGGLLQSWPLRIEVSREQLQFIDVIAKIAAILCAVVAVAQVGWATVLKIRTGDSRSVRIKELP
jgi:hypothetical protein